MYNKHGICTIHKASIKLEYAMFRIWHVAENQVPKIASCCIIQFKKRSKASRELRMDKRES